jgi:HEAT repeat protein
MDAWRNAIVGKDADTVLSLDGAFTGNPGRYAAALVKSATTDDNERVRAFSTRVLGKIGAPALAEVFASLLDDKSPYVRQNAAWALGELGVRPDGRAAAQRATTELRRLEQNDAAKDVRVAANSALKRLQ